MLHSVAVCCSVLQCVAGYGSVLQCVAVFYTYLSNWAAMEEASADNRRAAVAAVAPASVVHLSSITYVLQSVAVCCGMLQCVAVWDCARRVCACVFLCVCA